MANQKRESFLWLGLHVALYTAVLLTVTLFLFPWQQAVKFCVLNGLLHLVTDYLTSNIAFKFKSRPRIYYPIIGFDQFIHTATLIIVAYYALGS